MRRSLRVFVIMAVALMLALPSMVSADEINQNLAQSSTIDKVMRAGKLRVGLSTFVPWAMQDKEGKWIGFEVDVAQKLADDMGVTLELVPTKWEGLIPSLLTGKFDLIIAGMMSTPQRALKINFSVPYDYTPTNLLIGKKFAEGVKEPQDLNKEGITIAARVGTIGAGVAKEMYDKATVRLFPDEGPMVQEVLNGNAAALITAAPLPAQLAIRYPDQVVLLDKDLMMQPICMGVPKGDPDTVFYLNSWIVVQRNNGFLEGRTHYWWKTLEWESRMQ